MCLSRNLYLPVAGRNPTSWVQQHILGHAHPIVLVNTTPHCRAETQWEARNPYGILGKSSSGPPFPGKVLGETPFPSSEGMAFYFDEAQLSFKGTTAEGDHCSFFHHHFMDMLTLIHKCSIE